MISLDYEQYHTSIYISSNFKVSNKFNTVKMCIADLEINVA